MTSSAVGTAVEVEPLHTGEVRMPYAYAFRPEGNPLSRVASLVRPSNEALRSPCLAFVVRHPDAGTILVDTGLHPDAAADVRKDFGVRMALLFRGLCAPEGPFDDQLRGRGIDPAGVERVVMTHLHVDHTSGMRLLPNARFTCSRREWEAATASGSGSKGFVARHLPGEERMDLVDLKADGEPHGPFARTVDLLGDGSVRLVATPGHTPGHLSVLLRTPGERQVLLVGDAAYTLRNIDEQVLPLITGNDGAYRASLTELKAFVDRYPDAHLVPSHDPDAWRELTK